MEPMGREQVKQATVRILAAEPMGPAEETIDPAVQDERDRRRLDAQFQVVAAWMKVVFSDPSSNAGRRYYRLEQPDAVGRQN